MRRRFEALADRIDAVWRAANYDEVGFPELAAAEISSWLSEGSPFLERALDEVLDEVVRWAVGSPTRPRQLNLDSGFGQPPICLASRERFFIEGLFWREGTTQIHEHAFSGAFTVLHGSSVHSRYEFERSGVETDDLQLGTLRFSEAELLAPGDVRRIIAGPAFIHALFHLEHPTLSLVVRTHGSKKRLPQLTYRCGVASSSSERTLAARSRHEVLSLMADLGARWSSDEYVAAARAAIAGGDLLFAHDAVLSTASQREASRVAPGLLDAVEARFGAAWAEGFREAWREERRVQNIGARRKIVRDPEDRFFLALLLNVPTRAAIFEMIRRRYEDVEPEEQIVRWVEQLAATASPDRDAYGENLLGLSIPEGGTDLLLRLLRDPSEEGLSFDELKTALVFKHSLLLARCL